MNVDFTIIKSVAHIAYDIAKNEIRYKEVDLTIEFI